jgi:pimeloyl-ACP methyl ester carboxylesterase
MLKDLLRLQLDMGLTMTELGWGLTMSRSLDRICTKGDGAQPVMLIPGFNAPENTLGNLARFLNRNGFDAQPWGLGVNAGPRKEGFDAHVEHLANKLRHRVQALANRHSRGVALIGHSLGGVCARELALHLEPYIDRVITLGAPIFPLGSLRRHNSVVRMMGERQMGRPMEEVFIDAGTRHWPAHKPEMPCVAIVSPIDAAVSEPFALIPQSIVVSSRAPAIRENVRINASHGGMGVNPRILLAVADRLCADADDWQPFDYRRLRLLHPFPKRRDLGSPHSRCRLFAENPPCPPLP